MPSIMVVTIDNEPHVSVPEAARMKGVTRQAIWEACRRKRLPAIQRGRFWYVALAELRRWRPHGRRAAA